ncbi:hypothetical protein H6768_00615 [Candidatus Peribacteria bacterium]|nr:hypothetical protein [Candidatus Peribacteria bacterium]
MHLIINPSDIYYLTGVRPHDPGEILIISDIDAIRVVFCDLRTSALFDKKQYHVCDVRGKWDKVFATYTNLNTDPDFLTQTLREKIEGYGVSLFFTKSPISARRVIKNNQEIHQLKKSQQLNKTVYEKILPFLQI